jgi:hypothetical protein
MAIPFPFVTSNPENINTGSYLNQKETTNFVSNFLPDLWYGFSEEDVIEVSVFDLDQNPIGWKTINTDKNYRTVTLSYLNTLDQTITYSYKELLTDFTLYKTEEILVNPIEQFSSSFGIISGSYLATYNFVREMAGNSLTPLVVKDISPSRKEVKLVPLFNNTARYQAFCTKKLQVKEVAPLLLRLTNQCPYDQIYSRIKDKYTSQIIFLKNLLYLQTDGEFVSFLKTIYEDVIIYTSPSDITQPQERLKRTQGIRNYYQNYLLSNYETITDFIEIDNSYDSFATHRIEQQFKPYGLQLGKDFIDAKQFLIDFFTTEFYHPITVSTKASFDDKYYSLFKNALNLGNNTTFIILDHAYMDERITLSDPLTLLVKLKEELPDDVKIQSQCWVSNISLAPFVVNIIFKQMGSTKTIKISSPNFTLESDTISLYNVNTSYTANELVTQPAGQQNIDISKKINELSVDYSDFSNFVIFSSANQRTANFKTKVISWYQLSSSLMSLNTIAAQSTLSGSAYPYYSTERDTVEGQMNEIVNSFDGYESYLFRSGSYEYNPITRKFINASYVSDKDTDAAYYDKSNRDSLISNTPDHIVLDSDNDEYLIFLNMIGHFFDNIYLYITNLPSEKFVVNDPTKTFSKKVIDYMLDSFGWKLGSTYEDLSTIDTYTTSAISLISAEDRTKAIRTRILTTLPQIYKTTGTEEAIKLLLACHGIPSDLLQIREYGGYDYYTGSMVTYTKRERACMFGISGSGATINQVYEPRPNVRTAEFKLTINSPEIYPETKRYRIVDSKVIYSVNWGGYPDSFFPNWEIGFWREYGKMGRIYASLPTRLSSYSGKDVIGYGNPRIFLTSSLFPLFDGDIFNIRLRRNNPDPYFQYTADEELVTTQYDLTVQRNESGRVVFRSIDSKLGLFEDNMIWDGISTFDPPSTVGSLGTTNTASINWGIQGSKVDFAFGNAMIWDVPISDTDFDIHCNDYSSFAYSGSEGMIHLIARMDADEATNFLTISSSYLYQTPTGSSTYGFGIGTISNKSEYYPTFIDKYGAYVLSSSYMGSNMSLYNKPIIPIGFYYSSQNYFPLNPNIVQTTYCPNLTTSLVAPKYPYEYVVKDLEKIYTTPFYGPNRFKNEKVNKKEQEISARLDDKDRSTFDSGMGSQTDSNLLGLYLDPQDAKNRDIIKYLGNQNLMELIADPSDMYSSSYSNLTALNREYNSFGDRRVLYNELITLYKIYFNRSIFDTVKNIVPARSAVRTGILIEPTVLERSKYQYQPIFSESNTGSVAYFDVTASHYWRDPITKLLKFSGSVGNTSNGKFEILYGEFNIAGVSSSSLDMSTLPVNPHFDVDISYINEANFNYPINYGGGYITDLADEFQMGNYGSLGNEWGYSDAIGVTPQGKLETHTHPSGSERTFIVKKWDKYTIYAKTGPYVKTSNKFADLYTSSSIWLYSLVGMTPTGYNNLFYTSSKNELSGSVWDLTPTRNYDVEGYCYYQHYANTAKKTPNQRINTIKATDMHIGPVVYATTPYYDIAQDTYFEVFGGYPRNHYTHKRMQFSPLKMQTISGKATDQTYQIYVRSRQTVETTIDDKSGIGDASLPVQTIQTSNINLIKSNNVINM